MKPIVDGLETQFGDQLAFQRINANEGWPGYIQGRPTILTVDKAGREIKRFIGPQPAEALAEIMQETIALTSSQLRLAGTPTPLLPLMGLRLSWVAKFILSAALPVMAPMAKVHWKQPDANGNMPAPPHDDRGYTWHHADELLIIRNGFHDPLKPPESPLTLPAFRTS